MPCLRRPSHKNSAAIAAAIHQVVIHDSSVTGNCHSCAVATIAGHSTVEWHNPLQKRDQNRDCWRLRGWQVPLDIIILDGPIASSKSGYAYAAYIQHSAILNAPPIATTVESDLARLTRGNRVIAHVESQIGNHPIIAVAQNHAVSG